MFKILVPVNGSDCALKAVDEAIRAAQEANDARLYLVNVQPLFNRHIARFFSRAQLEGMREHCAQQALSVARQRVEQAGLRCSSHMLRGAIVPSLTTFATQQRIDEIVVGTSAVRGIGLWLKRPIADQLIRASAVPVDVVSAGPVSPLERYGLPAGLGLGATMVWLASE